MPVLAANCVRCHGAPPLFGATTGFRLDGFADLADVSELDPSGEVVVLGARSMAQAIATRVADEARPMPPRFPLDDYQREVLERWALAPERGAPRADNQLPTLTLEELSRSGDEIVLAAHASDRDGDLVTGELRVRTPAGNRLLASVRSGRVMWAWTTQGVAPGSYPVFAQLDDGAGPIMIELGTIEVTP